MTSTPGIGDSRARGVDIESPPHRLDAFGIYSFFVRGPDGYRLEFQQFLDLT